MGAGGRGGEGGCTARGGLVAGQSDKKIRGVTTIKRLDTEEKRKIEKRRTREKRQRAHTISES